MSLSAKDKATLLFAVVVTFVLVLVFGVGPWVVESYFEASAYEKLTGKEVSTWDAMWVQLRVDCN